LLRKISLALLFFLLAAAPPAGDEDCLTCPQVELERDGKPIVAVKTSPDEVSDVFVIEYLDVQTGVLESFDEKRRTATVAGRELWWNGASRIEAVKTGEYVWAVYNPDLTDDSGAAYLLELKPAEFAKTAHYELQRFVIYDPPPYQTLVRFGEDARAYGHLALVERVRGVYEKITLGSGKAEYREDEDRFVTTFSDEKDAVSVIQGRSHASGRRLDYDNDSGDALLRGPVSISRDGDRPLSGSADSLTYNVDAETITLRGRVVFEQNNRTTTADTAVLIEKAGYAYLYGEPVVSKGADGEIRGNLVRYDLDDGELLVVEGVKATFEEED